MNLLEDQNFFPALAIWVADQIRVSEKTLDRSLPLSLLPQIHSKGAKEN